MNKKTTATLLTALIIVISTASLSYYVANQPNQTPDDPSPTPNSTPTPIPSTTPTSKPHITPEPTTSTTPDVPEPTPTPTSPTTPTPTPTTDAVLVDYWETARTINGDIMTVWIKYTLKLRGYSSVNINIAEICLNGTYYPTNNSSYFYTLTTDEHYTSSDLSYELPTNSTYVPMYYSEFLNFEFTAT